MASNKIKREAELYGLLCEISYAIEDREMALEDLAEERRNYTKALRKHRARLKKGLAEYEELTKRKFKK